MKHIYSTVITSIAVLMLVWILASWANVLWHNDPFEDDGEPAGWNVFVVAGELLECAD